MSDRAFIATAAALMVLMIGLTAIAAFRVEDGLAVLSTLLAGALTWWTVYAPWRRARRSGSK